MPSGCSIANAFYQGDDMIATNAFASGASDHSIVDRMGGISARKSTSQPPAVGTTLQSMFIDTRPISNGLVERRRPPDTLPSLQAIYKEPAPPNTSRLNNPPPPLSEPRNYFEQAFHVHDNTDTIASLGIDPQGGSGRKTGPILRIDALEPALFKPPKAAVSQADMRTRPFPNRLELQSPAGDALCRANAVAKIYSANGALNYYSPYLFNQKDGYAAGAMLQPRGGGVHPRARFFVPQAYKQSNIMYGRPGNPAAINQKLPALSYVKSNPNVMTRGEYYRPPFPYNKGRQGFGLRPDCVTMKPVNRGSKFEYAGQAFSHAQTKDELRLKNYNIRPKNIQEYAYTGPRFRNRAPIGSTMTLTEFNSERGNPCRTVKELGSGRPSGPMLALDGIGDALHEERMVDAVMRACPNKGTGALSMDRRGPVPTRTDAPQYNQDFPGNSIKKVSVEILRDIDPTLISAYKSNPYVQPINN